MGERTPHLDSNARGALVGLTASHTRAHVVRAILEGVAFSLRDTFTLFREMNVPVTASASAVVVRVHPCGARFRPTSMATPSRSSSRRRRRLRCCPSRRCRRRPLAHRRRCLRRTVRVVTRVNPQPSAVAVLNASYSAFRRIYPATREIFCSQLSWRCGCCPSRWWCFSNQSQVTRAGFKTDFTSFRISSLGEPKRGFEVAVSKPSIRR